MAIIHNYLTTDADWLLLGKEVMNKRHDLLVAAQCVCPDATSWDNQAVEIRRRDFCHSLVDGED